SYSTHDELHDFASRKVPLGNDDGIARTYLELVGVVQGLSRGRDELDVVDRLGETRFTARAGYIVEDVERRIERVCIGPEHRTLAKDASPLIWHHQAVPHVDRLVRGEFPPDDERLQVERHLGRVLPDEI